MVSNKKCLRCDRILYKNDYCKLCLREIKYEHIQKYYLEHPSSKYNLDFWKERDKENLEFKKQFNKQFRKTHKDYDISNKLRSKIRRALKSKTESSQNTYNELLGCSIQELKKYLEHKFAEGMTWENYGLGGWQIDHIIPCQDFNLLDPEEQKKCFHFTNLQLLWAMENFNKNGIRNRKKLKRKTTKP